MKRRPVEAQGSLSDLPSCSGAFKAWGGPGGVSRESGSAVSSEQGVSAGVLLPTEDFYFPDQGPLLAS